MEHYSERIINNLKEMQGKFGFSDLELLMSIQLAEKINWLPAKPGNIALAIIRIMTDIPNKEIYRKGKTTYMTLKKWYEILCAMFQIPDKDYF